MDGSKQLSLESRRHIRGGSLGQMKVTGSWQTRYIANKYKEKNFFPSSLAEMINVKGPFKHTVVMSQGAFFLAGAPLHPPEYGQFKKGDTHNNVHANNDYDI